VFCVVNVVVSIAGPIPQVLKSCVNDFLQTGERLAILGIIVAHSDNIPARCNVPVMEFAPCDDTRWNCGYNRIKRLSFHCIYLVICFVFAFTAAAGKKTIANKRFTVKYDLQKSESIFILSKIDCEDSRMARAPAGQIRR